MTDRTPTGPPKIMPPREVIRRDSGLEFIDLVVGDGEVAVSQNRVHVRHRGWLTDGTLVESTGEEGETALFFLGDPFLLAGWREGIVGMRVGGTRRLILPSDLAYGSRGKSPRIPPFSTLIYDLELMAIEGST